MITLLHHNRISQTNKKGFFSFKHIPRGTYRFDIPEIFPRKVNTAIVVSNSSPKAVRINLVIENVCKASRDSALKDIEEGAVKLRYSQALHLRSMRQILLSRKNTT